MEKIQCEDALPESLKGEQELERIEHVRSIRDGGFDPYGQRFHRTHTASELQALYGNIEIGEEKDEVATAGRLMAVRSHGKTVFANLQDVKGQIQLYFRKDRLTRHRSTA